MGTDLSGRRCAMDASALLGPLATSPSKVVSSFVLTGLAALFLYGPSSEAQHCNRNCAPGTPRDPRGCCIPVSGARPGATTPPGRPAAIPASPASPRSERSGASACQAPEITRSDAAETLRRGYAELDTNYPLIVNSGGRLVRAAGHCYWQFGAREELPHISVRLSFRVDVVTREVFVRDDEGHGRRWVPIREEYGQ